MAEIQLLMPEMGESVTDATINTWLVQEGDTVEVDQDILEVSTDKVDTEVPSPAKGVIKTILHQEGEVVEVGKPLAIIEVEGNATVQASPAVEAPTPVAETPAPVVATTETKEVPFVPEANAVVGSNTDNGFYSPLVRSIAKEENISDVELQSINGSGKDGRVTKDDVLAYLANRGSKPAAPAASVAKVATAAATTAVIAKAAQPAKPKPAPKTASAVKLAPGDELVEMDRMRKKIAEHMVNSAYTSPHVTLFIEADVTGLYNWRNKVKNDFQKKNGERLTFTPLFVEAVTTALREFPGINASIVDGDKIHYKKAINVGMAAALPDGNLIVPVIKNCQDKTLVALARDVNDLAGRARASKLKPDDTFGGSFTLTNIGTFDNLMGTPIINQPQSAILATGAIKKKPVVLETAEGDVIAIRQMMYLSLAMDHRIIDGALGGAFLKRVKDELENWDTNRAI